VYCFMGWTGLGRAEFDGIYVVGKRHIVSGEGISGDIWAIWCGGW